MRYGRLIFLLVFFVTLLLLIRRSVAPPESLVIYMSNEASPTNHPEKNKFPHDERLAYVCLCANVRAVYPTLVLFQQLVSVGGGRGVPVALISTEVPEEYLQVMRLFNITTITYAPRPLFKLAYEPHSKSTWERDRILWQKLRVWDLVQFEKVIMLDYDLLLLKNFDELFDQKELSGVPMIYQQEKVAFWKEPSVGDSLASIYSDFQKITDPKLGWTGLNSGVLVLKPSKETFKELLEAASKLSERTCCPSQEFIFRFFEVRGQYNRLPPIYNLRKAHLFTEEEQAHYRETCKIYHFVEKRKPIVMGRKQAQGDAYSAAWWKHASAVDYRLEAYKIFPVLVRTMRIEAIRSALT